MHMWSGFVRESIQASNVQLKTINTYPGNFTRKLSLRKVDFHPNIIHSQGKGDFLHTLEKIRFFSQVTM